MRPAVYVSLIDILKQVEKEGRRGDCAHPSSSKKLQPKQSSGAKTLVPLLVAINPLQSLNDSFEWAKSMGRVRVGARVLGLMVGAPTLASRGLDRTIRTYADVPVLGIGLGALVALGAFGGRAALDKLKDDLALEGDDLAR